MNVVFSGPHRDNRQDSDHDPYHSPEVIGFIHV
jgi:hypothetical protein